jgi:hypothetical protein
MKPTHVFRTTLGTCFTALLLLLALPVTATEQILNYQVEIDIRDDASLDVTEHITVRAEGDNIRRGIYRDFPTRYRDRHGNNVVVDLEVLGVERDGQPEPWFTESRANGVRINTGNDDYLPRLPGDYRLTLRYRTTRQLGFFERHDELYWNAIGTGWDFAIAAGAVEVRLPEAVPVEQMAVEAYTGRQGAKGQDYHASVVAPGVARWTLSAPLQPREGLTIVLSFPKGLVPEPTTGQRMVWLLADNRGVLVALVGLALLLTYCVRRWRAVGRDPRAGVIIARYEPPADWSAAELRYLRRGGYDTRCFTSDLLTMAVAGRVVIEREDRLLLSDRWHLERSGDTADPSGPASASALLSSLFSGGKLKLELDNDHASHFQNVQRTHKKAIEQRLLGSHYNHNIGSAMIAFGIAAASAALAVFISGGAGIPIIIAICALMLITTLIFRKLIKAPTPEGRRLIDEAEGLKRYLSVAERDELKSLEGPGAPPPLDAQRYETLLPFAVALDVEEAWTKKFTAAVGVAAAAAVTSGITWYRGGGISDLGSLATAVSSGLNSSIASASTPPGSSSGGGGGGSSGGGGGGGGGGGR